MESIKKPKNVNPTSRRATFSEGELESIKNPKNVNPTSRRATFSEGELDKWYLGRGGEYAIQPGDPPGGILPGDPPPPDCGLPPGFRIATGL